MTVSQYFKNKIEDCEGDQKAWEALMADYKVVYPELGMELEERISGNALVNLHDLEAIFKDVAKTATREASGDILQKLVMQLPNLVGGSADLGPSNKTVMKMSVISRKQTAAAVIFISVCANMLWEQFLMVLLCTAVLFHSAVRSLFLPTLCVRRSVWQL